MQWGGKETEKMYYLYQCLTKVKVFSCCSSTLLAEKWVAYVNHSHGFEVLHSPSSGCIYWKPNFNQRKGPFMSFLYISKSRQRFHLHRIHDRNMWCFFQSPQPSVIYIIRSILYWYTIRFSLFRGAVCGYLVSIRNAVIDSNQHKSPASPPPCR